jgi:hypothetical protein
MTGMEHPDSRLREHIAKCLVAVKGMIRPRRRTQIIVYATRNRVIATTLEHLGEPAFSIIHQGCVLHSCRLLGDSCRAARSFCFHRRRLDNNNSLEILSFSDYLGGVYGNRSYGLPGNYPPKAGNYTKGTPARQSSLPVLRGIQKTTNECEIQTN